MSFREEERQKNNCPSRGLGLAAAAIGVGVGAALYYFFNKKPENPDGQGATASGWAVETLSGYNSPHNLQTNMDVDSDEYSTISENLTSDTSMNDDEDFIQHQSFSSTASDTGEESFETDDNIIELDTSDMGIDEEWEMSLTNSSLGEISITDSDSSSNSGMDDWDITNTSVDITAYTFTSRTEEEQMNILREQAYRERPRTSEDCSICFELIQRTQESMALPCTHNFHQECILPWLQEHQTCPNCRKRIE